MSDDNLFDDDYNDDDFFNKPKAEVKKEDPNSLNLNLDLFDKKAEDSISIGKYDNYSKSGSNDNWNSPVIGTKK